jgi:hypothetical protein
MGVLGAWDLLTFADAAPGPDVIPTLGPADRVGAPAQCYGFAMGAGLMAIRAETPAMDRDEGGPPR